MARPDLKNPAGAKPAVPAKAKAKPLGYVNWSILNENGDSLIRSHKGFTILDNEYLTVEEKALIRLATENDGQAIIRNVEFRIILHQEKPDELDISKIQLVKKAV